jgi:hypothetical protein
MKIPNATHSWKLVTKPPRMEAGAISALKTGIVEILIPIPMVWVSFGTFGIFGTFVPAAKSIPRPMKRRQISKLHQL